MLTILVVENDGDIVDFLQELLTQLGYEIAVAGNGQQALSYLQHNRPAAILSDITMPGMDGIELCRLVAKNEQYQTIPFILMSASDQRPKRDDVNYTAFLAKPFRLPALIKTLADATTPPST